MAFEKIAGRKTTTYNAAGDWYIDVVETPDEFEAWIWMEPYGHKSFMWGQPKEQSYGIVTRKEFMDMVKVSWIDYVGGYIDEVNDLEQAATDRIDTLMGKNAG